MAKCLLVLAVTLWLLLSCAADENNYTNCDSDITVLEKALYRPENIKQLNLIFYPPREASSRFIKVTYEFEDRNCSVTYFWAIGGFLLMQPPKIFKLTSLYFSTPANKLTDLVIKLPSECWPLVNDGDDNCTCLQDDDTILDIVTQQLDLYAKYNGGPHGVTKDSPRYIQAICDEELKHDYYGARTRLFMACTAVIPIFFIVTLTIIIRSYYREINSELAKDRNHGNFTALILVGVFTQLVIVGMDIAAVYYVYTGQYEFKDYDLQNTINLFITVIILAFDSAVGSITFLCLIYLWCTLFHKNVSKNCKNCDCCPELCLECCLPCCLIPCFYAIFGDNKLEKGWKIPDDYTNDECETALIANRRTSWILLITLISPLFSVAAHCGYILIAWLTEPSNTTSTALITLAVILYSSMIFRQCYVANVDIDLSQKKCIKYWWSVAICCYPLCQCFTHIYNIYKKLREHTCYICNVMDQESVNGEDITQVLLGKGGRRERRVLNMQAFCITMGWGVLTVGSLAFTIIAFYEIPFKTLDLVTYLLNIFQTFIVIIALLITYKIFILSEPDVQRFFQQVRKSYKAKRGNWVAITEVNDETVGDVEASGAIVGNALEVVIHQ